MKPITLLLMLTIFLSCKQEEQKVQEHQHQEVPSDKENATQGKPLSPHTSTMAMIGDAHIHIDYSSPGVRDRIVFGGLLPYDKVWQSGAHMATWVETNKDLQIDGNTLPAGKYGFFTIPSKEEWTIIFNSNWDQHGKDEYDENDDVLRFKVKPTILDNSMEHLTYTIEKTGDNSGEMSLAWEKIKVQFPFVVKD